MYAAVPKRRSRAADLGKWRRVDSPGLNPPETIEHRGWTISIIERRAGLTLRRQQFSAVIRRKLPFAEKYMGGFRTKASALAAAYRNIDEREAEKQHTLHTAHAGLPKSKRLSG